MTSFLVACILLTLVMIGFVAVPLLRVRGLGVAAREAANVDLYRQRLAELEAERERGELADDDYETLKAELGGNLLDDVDTQTTSPGRSRHPHVRLAAVLGVVLVGAGVLLYQGLGALDLVVLDQNRTLLGDASAPEDRLAAWADGLEAHLADHPDDVKSWYLLGHARLRQDRYESAVSVFETVAGLTDDDPVVLASLVQARYMADDGVISDANRATMMRVLEAAPHEANVREMLAMDAFRRESYAEAAQHLELALAGGVGGARADALKSALERAKAAGGITESPVSPAATATAVDPATSPAAAATSGVAAGPVDAAGGIRVRVSLAPGVAASGRVFVIARESGGPPMPVAVKVLAPSDLPAEIVLSDADAMQPERALSRFERLEVLARLSKSGNAMRGIGG